LGGGTDERVLGGEMRHRTSDDFVHASKDDAGTGILPRRVLGQKLKSVPAYGGNV
jgi:hypothetical protein